MSVEQKKIVKLTPKQEKFCQNVVSGMTGKDAYIDAYDTKGSPETVYTEVTRLFGRDDIQARMKALREPIVEAIQGEALSERDRIKNILWERLQKAIEREDDATIVKYTDQINRMNAEYININRNIEDKSAEIDQLDADTLRRLAETQ